MFVMCVLLFTLGIIATLPMGPSGLYVVSTSIENGSGNSNKAFAGVIIAEILFTLVAFGAFLYPKTMGLDVKEFTANFEHLLPIVSAPILIYFSICLIKKGNEKVELSFEKDTSSNYFLTGLLLCLFNPTIIIFYITILVGIEPHLIEHTNLERTIALFSFQLGGLLTLKYMAHLGQKYRSLLIESLPRLNKVAGILLLLFTSFNLIKSSYYYI